MKVAVLIPCYNEELTVEKVVKDFRKELKDADIYVYDNNSKDNTAKLAKKAGAIVRHEYKQGKGHVVKSMFYDIDADIYIMVDGDDTYPADAVHKLMQPVIDGKADMVNGDRLSSTYFTENKRLFHNFGNKLVKNSINFLFKSNVKDIMTGYRVFNKKFVKNVPIMSPNFEVETEMTIYALDKKMSIVEIPVQYRDRPAGSVSKLNTIKDGIKVVKTIIRMFRSYKPMLFYGILSFISLVVGLSTGIPSLVMGLFKHPVLNIFGVLGVLLSIVFFAIALILDTSVRQNKENYELNLLRYKDIEDMKK